jgi:hypothetical protein
MKTNTVYARISRCLASNEYSCVEVEIWIEKAESRMFSMNPGTSVHASKRIMMSGLAGR